MEIHHVLRIFYRTASSSTQQRGIHVRYEPGSPEEADGPAGDQAGVWAGPARLRGGAGLAQGRGRLGSGDGQRRDARALGGWRWAALRSGASHFRLSAGPWPQSRGT